MLLAIIATISVINFETADHATFEVFEDDADFSIARSIRADVLKSHDFVFLAQFCELELLHFQLNMPEMLF